MDLFTAVFIVPPTILLLLGFFGLCIALKGHVDLSRFKVLMKPRGSEVDSSYWGQYVKGLNDAGASGATSGARTTSTVAASTSIAASSISLPTLKKPAE